MKKSAFSLLIVVILLGAGLGMPAGTSAQDDSFTLFFTEDQAFSSVLPNGWAANGSREDGLILASSEATLQLYQAAEDSKPQPGDLIIQVYAFPEEAMAGLPMTDFLSAVAQEMQADSDAPPELSDLEEFDLAGREAAVVTGVSSEVGAHVIMYLLAPGHYALAVIATTPDDLDAVTEDAMTILATVRFSLSLDETQDDEYVTFGYPTGWVLNTFEGMPPIYGLANSEEAFNAEDLIEGQYKIILADLGASFGVDVANLSVADATVAWVQGLLNEGETATDPITITLDNGVEIVTLDVLNKDGSYVGGVFVAQFTAFENVVEGVAFASAPDASYQISLTALNMLLGLQVAPPQ
jgi:hypothetical protein